VIRRAILGLGLALIPAVMIGAGPIPPNAPNCQLASPPATAGESQVHGILVKIYPRKLDMGPNYTGCQNSWIDREGTWELFSALYFEAGEFRAWRMLSDDKPPKHIYCRYKNFTLEPDSPKECYVPAKQSIPSSSYAPGCMRQAIRRHKISDACSRSLDHGAR